MWHRGMGMNRGVLESVLAELKEPFQRQARSVQSKASAAPGKGPWLRFVDEMKT